MNILLLFNFLNGQSNGCMNFTNKTRNLVFSFVIIGYVLSNLLFFYLFIVYCNLICNI